jgi:hypothetical protein
MSLFKKWWDAANSKDRNKMAELLDDDYVFIRRATGEEWGKDEMLDFMMTDGKVKDGSDGTDYSAHA